MVFKMAALRIILHAVFLVTLCIANDGHDFARFLVRIKELEEGQMVCMQHISVMRELQARLNQAESRLLELSGLDSKLQEANVKIHDLEIALTKNKAEAAKEETSNSHPKQSANSSQEEIHDKPYVNEVVNKTHRIHLYQRDADAPTLRVTMSTVRVAFSAYVKNDIVNLGANHIIHFDTVIHNEGRGFDPLLGVFTCPVSGTYYFQTTILSKDEDFVDTYIVLDDYYTAGVHSSPGRSTYGQSGNAVIMHCAEGQRVWVKTVHDQHGTTNVYGDKYSTFIGHMLWEDHA